MDAEDLAVHRMIAPWVECGVCNICGDRVEVAKCLLVYLAKTQPREVMLTLLRLPHKKCEKTGAVVFRIKDFSSFLEVRNYLRNQPEKKKSIRR